MMLNRPHTLTYRIILAAYFLCARRIMWPPLHECPVLSCFSNKILDNLKTVRIVFPGEKTHEHCSGCLQDH